MNHFVSFPKICDTLADENVVVDDTNSGLVCKITCPICNSNTSLSSSVNKKTGTSSFSIHNFKRHFEKSHDRNSSDIRGQINSPSSSANVDLNDDYNRKGTSVHSHCSI